MTSHRTYETTHPWLTFRVDLARANAKLWIQLGECQSKSEHIAGVPMRPETAQRLHNVYLAKGVLGTTAIEGNTLSEEEVLRHIEGKLHLPESREYLAQEITNIIDACNHMVVDGLENGCGQFASDSIKELNRRVLDKLTVDEGVVPGEIRKHSVGVARYRGAPAEDCQYLLDRLCEWLGGETFESVPGLRIVYAILKAILAHLYLAWIHPFGDGNGRTARLLEVKILLEAGMPTPAVHLLSNHYNLTRSEYYRQLDRASQSGGDVLPFIEYAVQGLVDGLRGQIEHIRAQQLDVAWINYVHESFRNRHGVAEERRRHLVLDLSNIPDPIPLSRLRTISARVAAAYANKTPITLNRDLTALVDMDLIKRSRGGYYANKNLITAFLPEAILPAEDFEKAGLKPAS